MTAAIKDPTGVTWRTFNVSQIPVGNWDRRHDNATRSRGGDYIAIAWPLGDLSPWLCCATSTGLITAVNHVTGSNVTLLSPGAVTTPAAAGRGGQSTVAPAPPATSSAGPQHFVNSIAAIQEGGRESRRALLAFLLDGSVALAYVEFKQDPPTVIARFRDSETAAAMIEARLTAAASSDALASATAAAGAAADSVASAGSVSIDTARMSLDPSGKQLFLVIGGRSSAGKGKRFAAMVTYDIFLTPAGGGSSSLTAKRVSVSLNDVEDAVMIAVPRRLAAPGVSASPTPTVLAAVGKTDLAWFAPSDVARPLFQQSVGRATIRRIETMPPIGGQQQQQPRQWSVGDAHSLLALPLVVSVGRVVCLSSDGAVQVFSLDVELSHKSQGLHPEWVGFSPLQAFREGPIMADLCCCPLSGTIYMVAAASRVVVAVSSTPRDAMASMLTVPREDRFSATQFTDDDLDRSSMLVLASSGMRLACAAARELVCLRP